MKILTTTLHSIDNCGSCLQAYALQQFVLQEGHENEIIDYRPDYAKNNGAPLKYFIKKIIFGKAIKRREQIFQEFVDNYLCVTKQRFHTYGEVKEANLQADVFVTGSDQVWNPYFPCGRDSVYYLEFTSGKKISYAASIGKNPIPENELDYVAEKVKDFSAISIREKSSVNFLKSKNLNAEWVCDPTLLFDKSFYEKIIIKKDIQKYILVYLVEKSELLDSILDYYKNEQGYKIVYVGSFLNRCKCDVNYTDVGPREFLGLISGAEFVLAGSFHALIFSCIFQKEFAILPYKNNARMEEFLQQFDLYDRYISDISDLNKVTPISWNALGEKMDIFIGKSKKWLKRNIEEIEKNIL